MKRWYVVNAQPHQERRAEENLRRQGFECWLPEFQKTRRHARRVEQMRTALFPGYLFVRLDTDVDRWRSVNGTFGVVKLLCSGDSPLQVPDTFIDGLLARRDETGAIAMPVRAFARDEAVQVAAGPFADLFGLFQEMAGPDRVVLLFSLLGRQVRASVPVAELAA